MKERELTPEEQKRLKFMKLNPGFKIMGPGRPHKNTVMYHLWKWQKQQGIIE